MRNFFGEYICYIVQSLLFVVSKIEKIPRGIRGEKSSKDMAIWGIWSQQLEHKQVPQWGTEPGVQKV